MVAIPSGTNDVPSSPDVDDREYIDITDLPTPTSPVDETYRNRRRRHGPENSEEEEKEEAKKSAKAKEEAAKAKDHAESDGRPPVLCISRNKHWRYISSYHGPWLQTPYRAARVVTGAEPRPATLSNNAKGTVADTTTSVTIPRPTRQAIHSRLYRCHHSSRHASQGKLPPPIDPGVFRSVTSIRRLIDEAAEFSVRAASGLSAAELGSMRGGSGLNNSPWAAAQSLGINPLGNNGGGGRNVAMSAMRIHRLRALAVQSLHRHTRPTRLLRVLWQLAESTSTKVLDELIAAQPQRLEYYRTRGIVHCFRDEFPQATKDFTYALKEARAVRKAKTMHRISSQGESRVTKSGKRRKGTASPHTNGQAPPDGTSPMAAENTVEGLDGEPLLLHHRESEGPLGRKDGVKLRAYREVLAAEPFREQVLGLLRKSIRDHEKFLSHFDLLEPPNAYSGNEHHDISTRQSSVLLSESIRPGNHSNPRHPVDGRSPTHVLRHTTAPGRIALQRAHLPAHARGLCQYPSDVRTHSVSGGRTRGVPRVPSPRSMGQAEFIGSAGATCGWVEAWDPAAFAVDAEG
ncbi:hypothetical protein Hypma_013430 [Hypsizygus marmoreus]|uniref:Uncharacterized protein n=1 Tax=Hypsizygus marmoreus TaxID=39966 RepID=A0A369JK94_HYPMA|nr:hypothetical protein Hypma_013430 [Hypsizygus marmoreus]